MPVAATRERQAARRRPKLKRPQLLVTKSTIRHVAENIYSTSRWLEEFGPLYNLTTVNHLKALCERTIAGEGSAASQLPKGWLAIKHGHRFYIYRAGQKLDEGKRGIKIPDEIVEAIRRRSKKGLVRGDQLMLARRYSISESQVSRIIHKLRRCDSQVLAEARTEIKAVPLRPTIVGAVFERLFLVKDWIDHVAKRAYGISNIQYVYQMCAGKPNGPSKKSRAKLPVGWRSFRVGDSWMIYHETLVPTNRLIKSQN